MRDVSDVDAPLKHFEFGKTRHSRSLIISLVVDTTDHLSKKWIFKIDPQN